jgi:bilirubin oxidase
VNQPLGWNDPITENPAVDATEVWEIYNFTADAHPIHVHEVAFEVVNREGIEDGAVRQPEVWETGLKDTVIAYPDEITRIKARFDLPGQYVWHCHIVEHEDHEMMRPFSVGPPQAPTP